MKVQSVTRVTVLLALICAESALARDEMVIEAARRSASVQDTPIAVTAISSESLEKLQIVEVADIGAMVPNLQTYEVTANGAAMQVHARGASVQSPGFITSESPVGLYVDDVYNGRLATANLDLLDVERIEVLRGPQGTLYGRNTSAGAIKIVTRTPGDEFYLYGQAGYGNYRTSKLGVAVGGPLVPENLAGSFAGSYQKRSEGYTKNPIEGIDLGEYENTVLRGKLHWYSLDNFKVTLTGWLIDAENDGYNGIPYIPFDAASAAPGDSPSPGRPLGGFYDNYSPATASPNGRANYGQTDQSGISLDWTWSVAGIDIRSITAYSDVDDEFGFDLAGGGFAGFAGAPGQLITSTSNMKQLSQELHAFGTAFDDRLDWIAGVFYMNEDGDQAYSGFVPQFPPCPANCLDYTENSMVDTESLAAFAEVTWRFTERWSVIAGARYTDEQKEFDLSCVGLTPSSGTGTCVSGSTGNFSTRQENDFNEFNPKLGINFDLDENQMLYGVVSSGFKAGGFQALCFGDLLCQEQTYQPEDVLSYEIGYKATIGTVQINAAAFFAQYEDLQQTVIKFSPRFVISTDNVGDADVWGIELDSSWAVMEGLDVFLNAGYMKDSLDLDPSASASSAGARDLPSRPDLTARIGFDYAVQVASGLDVFFGSDIQYVDDYFAEATNELQIDSYTRLNGFIGLRHPDGLWQVTLDGKNLIDDDDNVSGIYADGFANIRTVLPPREIMLNVRVRL